MSQSMELSAWHEAVIQGNIVAARKSAGLVMYDSDGKPVARYHLENAWPSKIELGGLKAGANEVLMETVTIVAERIQRVGPKRGCRSSNSRRPIDCAPDDTVTTRAGALAWSRSSSRFVSRNGARWLSANVRSSPSTAV
jgi:hypothetical protein